MNTLNKNIKISVLFSLIAIGATLAGCASRSSKTASTDSTLSASTSSTATTDQSDSSASAQTTTQATQGAQITGSIDGQAPINWSDLQALQKLGTLATTPAGQ
jgi:uncharacterized protein YceK